MGGGADDEGVSIEIDNNGSIYTVGTFDAGANFNPEGSYILQSNGSKDIFISKLSQCSNSIINTSPTLSALDTAASYQWLDCVNNYSLISGATSQSYTPTINGIYALEITTNYCVDTSACIVVNNVSIAENAANISLYPNPTNNSITLDIEGHNGEVNVEVYDFTGKLLKTTTNTTISMSEYAKGIYVFKVAYGNRVEELKVVKD
jgi:hypothetical protein